MMTDSITFEEVLIEYADAVGKTISTLTDGERRQAMLNAVLSGRRVEPFATFCDWADAELTRISPGVKTLNMLLQEMDAE